MNNPHQNARLTVHSRARAKRPDTLVRQLLTVAATALVANGYVQASDIEPMIGALHTIGSVVSSVVDKRGR